MNPDRIRIIHTDDEKFIRQSIFNSFQTEGIDIVAECSNGIELMNLLKKVTPDIVLLDLEMEKMNGKEALRLIKAKYPKVKVVIFSSYDDPHLISDIMQKGANAYLTKDTDIPTIINTIKKVHYSDNYTNFYWDRKFKFSTRELEVIPHILAGKTSKEIGSLLGISDRTVESMRTKIYDKVKCRNSSEFAAYGADVGLKFLGNNYQR